MKSVGSESEQTKDEKSPDPTRSLRRLVAGQPALVRTIGAGWRRLKRLVEGPRHAALQTWLNQAEQSLTSREWKMLTQLSDDTTPLPPGSDVALAVDNPRLMSLREAYARCDLPVTTPSLWDDLRDAGNLDLRYFRGHSAYVWQYREWPRAMTLKYFVFSEYVRARDPHDLLTRLGEDGAFGCWTYDYADRPPVSRDLLDSVNEILFLDRHLGLLGERRLRVVDIGAGYGRTAYRMLQAVPGIEDYCCVDAVPESTFLCEHYLRYRGCSPPARVVPLHEIEGAARPGDFDLALNIHSFSECTYEAITWWLEWLGRLRVPNLLIIPNDRDELLAYERNGTRRDFRPLLEANGYELAVCEPVLDEPAVRELVQVEDRFLLFRRTA